MGLELKNHFIEETRMGHMMVEVKSKLFKKKKMHIKKLISSMSTRRENGEQTTNRKVRPTPT